MRRKIAEKLIEWRNRNGRHPLILRGARQVGKTFLVRELAKGFANYLEVNFEEDGSVSELFRSKNPQAICELLEAKFDISLVDGKSLLFLDELQDAEPCVLASLRYFYEKRPGLHVVAAGSLLEFLLDADERKSKKDSFSMPVGRIEYMFVSPMDFEEFLLAVGKKGLCKWIQSYQLGDTVHESFHVELSDWFRKYLVIGGMPAVVKAYVDNGVIAAEREQQLLLSTYHDDFPKYSGRVPAGRIQKVFRAIPSMLAKKFVYAHVDADEKARDLSSAVRLLSLARVMSKVRHTSASGAPVGAGASEQIFKPLFLDVGLCSRALGLKLTDFLEDGDAILANHGPICEQFVGQHLLFAGAEYEEPFAYCWIREAPKSQAEVDYLIQVGTQVVPVEVKGGTTGSMKGLHLYLNEKHADFAVRFNADKPSYLKDAHARDVLGRACDFRFLSLPLYMACEVGRLAERVLKDMSLDSFAPGCRTMERFGLKD